MEKIRGFEVAKVLKMQELICLLEKLNIQQGMI